MQLKCKCGSEIFNVSEDKRFALCNKCNTVYDEYGKVVEIKETNCRNVIINLGLSKEV